MQELVLGRELGEGQQLLGRDESMRPEAREGYPRSRLRWPRGGAQLLALVGLVPRLHLDVRLRGLPIVPPTRSKYSAFVVASHSFHFAVILPCSSLSLEKKNAPLSSPAQGVRLPTAIQGAPPHARNK